MKRLPALCILFLAAVTVCVHAVPAAIAISDLQVSSANPKYEFIGKGLAELISFELAKSKSVTLVEREKRTQLLAEMEFSLSDLSDAGKQLEVGKLLAAKYMVFGELIDMDRLVLISLRMIDVESGEVVWRDKLEEPLSKYGRIAGYFAKSLLGSLKVEVAASTVKAAGEEKQKNEEAAIALSNAIASYDKKDAKTAKKDLEIARKLDPENQVVDAYLEKLSPTSAKYKVQLELFGPSANPAVLGVIRQDRIYIVVSNGIQAVPNGLYDVGDGFVAAEMPYSGRFGIELPLGQRMGLSAEVASGGFDNKINTPFSFLSFDSTSPSYYFHDLERNMGGTLNVGYALLKALSIGAGLHVYQNSIISYDYARDEEYVFASSAQAAVDVGFLLRNAANTLVFDVHGTYPIQKEYFLDVDSQEVQQDSLPIVLESTLTGAFLDRKLFCVLKALGDVYYGERRGFVARAIPVVEYWPWRFLSTRGGYQMTYLDLNGKTDLGHGFVVGITLRFGKYDLDVNYTNRTQPVRVLPGYSKPENFVLFGLSKNDTLLSR